MFKGKEYVYEVYREKSFSKAAQNLYISQPSLSARIKKIEELTGFPLFDRSTSPLQLTEVGEAYVKASEEIFQIEQKMENYINNLSTLKMGNLSIGASNLFAAYVMPALITDFKQNYPDINIRITEGNTAQLETMLSNNSLDFVIDNYRYDSTMYNKELYCRENILLAVPKRFAENEKLERYQLSYDDIKNKKYTDDHSAAVPLKELSALPFIMLTPGNDTRIRGDRLCREAGFHPDIILELNQQSTAYMAASTQLGATFISDILVSQLPSFENLVYYKLGGKSAEREVFFYYKNHKYKTRIMAEFLAFMYRTNQACREKQNNSQQIYRV